MAESQKLFGEFNDPETDENFSLPKKAAVEDFSTKPGPAEVLGEQQEDEEQIIDLARQINEGGKEKGKVPNIEEDEDDEVEKGGEKQEEMKIDKDKVVKMDDEEMDDIEDSDLDAFLPNVKTPDQQNKNQASDSESDYEEILDGDDDEEEEEEEETEKSEIKTEVARTREEKTKTKVDNKALVPSKPVEPLNKGKASVETILSQYEELNTVKVAKVEVKKEVDMECNQTNEETGDAEDIKMEEGKHKSEKEDEEQIISLARQINEGGKEKGKIANIEEDEVEEEEKGGEKQEEMKIEKVVEMDDELMDDIEESDWGAFFPKAKVLADGSWVDNNTLLPAGWMMKGDLGTPTGRIISPDGFTAPSLRLHLKRLLQQGSSEEAAEVKSKMALHGWKEDELLPTGWIYRPSSAATEDQQKKSFLYCTEKGELIKSHSAALKMAQEMQDPLSKNLKTFVKETQFKIVELYPACEEKVFVENGKTVKNLMFNCVADEPKWNYEEQVSDDKLLEYEMTHMYGQGSGKQEVFEGVLFGYNYTAGARKEGYFTE